jgi:hypothetical protein
MAGWLAVALPYVVGGVVLIGIRPDAAEELKSPAFVAQAFLPLSLSLASAASAFALGIPNRKEWWPPVATFSAFGAWAISLVYLIYAAHEAHAGAGLNCLRNIVALSLPPAVFFYCLLKRAAPLRWKMVGMMAILGPSALACSATRFICPNEDALHFFAWHFMPVVLLGAAGHSLGIALFKNNSR